MRENKIRRIWAEGGNVVNGFLGIPSSMSAEVMAHAGWDSLCIDLQHGAIDYQVALSMLQAISTTDTVPLVRAPWNDPAIIGKLLDAGAYGVICPMVNTRAQCEAFVGACRYPPLGYRSFGPIRAALVAGAGYPEESNDELLTFAMIETAEGLQNLEAIVATPGLDGVYIGPSDLSLSHGGKPNQDSQEPFILGAFQQILDACKAAGRRAGVHTQSAAYSQQMIAMGFDLVTVGSDTRYVQAGRGEVRQMRDYIAAR